MEQKLLYLFALLEAEKEPKGLPDGVLVREDEGFSIAYKEVDKQEFGDNLSQQLEDLEWVKEQAVAHETTIQALLPFGTVIPFKFGRIFENWERLRDKIKANQTFWEQEITRLRDKQEWSLKVMADTKILEKHLQQNQAELKRESEEIEKSSAGKAFFLKKKQTEKTKEVLNQKLEEDAQHLLDKLQVLTEYLYLKQTSQAEGNQGRLILNIVLLLKRDVDFFEWVEQQLEPLVAHQAYHFLVAGPWAAYHFLTPLPQVSNS